MKEKPFAGQVVIVTGGTQGIGWAMVQAFADQGAVVYACGRSAGSLAAAERERAALPFAAAIHLAQVDVTDRAGYEGWLAAIYAATGRVDVLVNNAAFVRWVDVLEMTVDEAAQTMRVGFDGVVYGVKLVLPWMLAAGRGHIVNVGSITSRIFVGGASAAYAAAKAAVDAYTETLHVELAPTPVRATIVRLGTVAGTDFFKKYVDDARMPRLSRFLPALTPPRVAAAVLRAVQRQQPILTLPRYLAPLSFIYNLAPGFSRWLARQGGQRRRHYDQVKWQFQPTSTQSSDPGLSGLTKGASRD